MILRLPETYLKIFGDMVKKHLFFFSIISLLLAVACTNTPWHKQQSELFLNKGISYIELRQYNNALKDLMEAEKYAPDDHRIHYYLGMSYHGKGLRDMALEEFKKAVELKEDYSEAWNYLGTMYLDRGLYDEAIASFNKALANYVYDTPSIALYNMAMAYYSKKDYQKSLARFNEALRIQPETVLRPQIEKNVGLIYYDQGKISEAIAHFKKAVELNSLLYDAHLLLGECYLKIKDNENARKSLQTVIKLSPESSFGLKAKSYLQSIQ